MKFQTITLEIQGSIFDELEPLEINDYGVVLGGATFEVITDIGKHKNKYEGFEILVAKFSKSVWRATGNYMSSKEGFSGGLSVYSQAFISKDNAVLVACEKLINRVSLYHQTAFTKTVIKNIEKVKSEIIENKKDGE